MSIKDKLFFRFLVVCALLLFGFFLVISQMFIIQTVEKDRWMDVSSTLKRRDRSISPNRGNIYTHDKKLISATIPYYTLLMDTRVPALHQNEGKLYKANIDTLAWSFANYFGNRSKDQYKNMINRAYLAGDGQLKLYPERVSYIDMINVRKFPLIKQGRYRSGFMTREFANRENLYGSLCARTVGNVYGAGQGGQYGLELAYDSVLCGKAGVSRGIRVGTGWLYETIEEPVEGSDLVTTIDIELQDICDQTLRSMLVKTDADRGCLILMDVKTGAIKASVNLSRVAKGAYDENFNMSVADLSEPGSTFKTMSLMVALEDGVCSLEDSIETYSGEYKFHGVAMTDHNKNRGGYNTITVAEAIAYSSNIGISRVIYEAYKDDPAKFVDAINKTKLTQNMNLEIPGSAVPVIPHPDTYKKWSSVSLPWMSIGYVAQMPPIYTLAFYNAIANGGKLMKPYYVNSIESQGEVIQKFKPQVINNSICSSSTLKDLHKVLELVMTKGTGKVAASDHVRIAGKTGTAQLGYGIGGIVRHQVSFCGYFPADDPKYSAIVVIRRPRIGYASGSTMAGGAFKKMAERVNAHQVKLSINDVTDESADTIVPFVMSGNTKHTKKVLNYLGLDYEFDDAEWIKVSVNEDLEYHGKINPVVDDYVPDVRGMGARDAVYLIEKCGMRVQIYGRGRVVRQSVAPKSKVFKGGTVTLIMK